jgi:hypothetical protein
MRIGRRTALTNRYRHRVRPTPAEPDELTVRCLENPDLGVRLYDRYFPDEYGTGFFVEMEAVGMRACFGPVEVWIWDDVDLPAFVAGLADDFRGWIGQRTWSTNHLRVDAATTSGAVWPCSGHCSRGSHTPTAGRHR